LFVAATVVHADDVEAGHGVYRALTDPLGINGFRVNRLELSGGQEGPEHDHAGNGQEEVYAVVGGGGLLRVDGQEIELRPGHFVYCPPEARRQMVAGDAGLVWIGIGSAVRDGSSRS
jgi:quercetin dioxygenase-like cupin family protein